MVCTLLAGVNVVAFAADDNDLVEGVHSVYNDAEKGGDGEHLYTKDLGEISWLVSLGTWNDEDVAWNAPVSSSTAIWRCYNPNSGEHLYVDEGYANYLAGMGWNKEKVAFYSDDNMGVPVYRLWNGLDGVGSHYFTTDEGEVEWLAGQGWTVEDIAFYGVKEEGEKEMTAAQTGSKEITVVSETEFTGAEEFTVMKGAVEQSVAATEFDDDMCTVTLTMDGNIAEAEYTVICSDLEYEPASFTGEVGKLSAIVLGDDLIAMGKNDAGKFVYVAGYKAVDQWLNDYEITSFTTATSTAGTVTPNQPSKGMITVVSDTELLIGSKQIVSLVKDTVVGTGELTVGSTSVAAEITVGELTATPTEALINTTGRVDVDDKSKAGKNYYFPVYAKDQYGNPLNKTMLNKMVSVDNSLIVSPEAGPSGVLWATGTKNTGDVFDELEDGTPIMYVTGDTKSYGKGLITLVSTSGAVGNAEATIAQNERIESVTFLTANLQAGKPAGAMVSAVNNYGEEVDLYDEVTYCTDDQGTEATDSVPVANLYFGYKGGNANGKTEYGTHIVFDNALVGFARDHAEEITQFFVVGTNKGVASSLVYTNGGVSVTPATYTVADAATLAGIKGLTTSAAKNTTFANTNSSITVNKNSFVWLDSDGEVMKTLPANLTFVYNATGAAPQAPNANTYYAVASVDSTKLQWTGANGDEVQPLATTQPGTYKVKVDLYVSDAQSKLTSLGSKSFEYKLFNADDKNMTYTATLMTGNPNGNPLAMAKSQLYIAQDDTQIGVDSPETAFILVTATDSNGATIVANNDLDGIIVTGGDIDVTNAGVVSVEYSAEDEAGVATAHVWANGKEVTEVAIPYDVEAPEALFAMFMDTADQSMYLSPTFTKVTGLNLAPTTKTVTVTTADGTYLGAVLDQYSHIMPDARWTINGKAWNNTQIDAGKTATLNASKDGVSGSWTLVTGVNVVPTNVDL